MAVTLKDLTQPEGIQHLIAVTGGPASYYSTPARAQGVQQVAQRAIKRNPNLAHTKVRIMPNLPNAFYNFDKGEILLGQVEPIGLEHEIEHADSVRQEGIYRKVLKAAQGITRINNVAAMPTVLALRTFIRDENRRNDILKTLSALSAAAAAPVLVEEAQASLRAIQSSPNKMEAAKTLGPAFMAHLLHKMAPTLVYQAGRKL